MDRCSHPLANLTDSQRVPRGAIVCSLHDAEHARYPIRSQGGDAPSTTRIPTPLPPASLFALVEKRYAMSLAFRVAMGFLMSVFLAFTMSLFSPIVAGAAVEPMGLLMGTLSGMRSQGGVAQLVPAQGRASVHYHVPHPIALPQRHGFRHRCVVRESLACTCPFAMDHLLRCRHTGGAPVHVPLVQDYAHPALVRRARGGSRGGRSLAVCASTAQRLA